MLDIEKEYKKQIIANKRLQCKIIDLKMQMREAKKELVSMKSDSIH